MALFASPCPALPVIWMPVLSMLSFKTLVLTLEINLLLVSDVKHPFIAFISSCLQFLLANVFLGLASSNLGCFLNFSTFLDLLAFYISGLCSLSLVILRLESLFLLLERLSGLNLLLVLKAFKDVSLLLGLVHVMP